MRMFPEQKCSGFIEARPEQCLATTHGGRFRSRNAPASLKLDRDKTLLGEPVKFPEQKCSGFIEAGTTCVVHNA